MKKAFSGIILILVLVATVFAGVILNDFRARSEGENIRLEWETGEESNLLNFKIERKTPESAFVEIATVPAKGNNSYYSYLDESVYKSNNLIFIYRLKVTESSGITSYSNTISVSPNISGLRRTWGSIKAMFR